MKTILPVELLSLAQKLNNPIYVVGGFVRNFLITGKPSSDIDLASNTDTDQLIEILEREGFIVHSVYKKLGTVKFQKNGSLYEYTRFRTESYKDGGKHTPDELLFTDDITADALRRDFKCNAIYYDVKNCEIVDPLGGVEDIKNKRISTVTDAEKVFSSDGLRLMRLARFSAELGFTPDEETHKGAKKYALNIKDISVERIFSELKLILNADSKYPFSPKDAHYQGLKILEKTDVLGYIFPELIMGKGMPQRRDFHDYDVLEHSLRCVLYAHPSVRLDALLHDIGKPFCLKRDNAYKLHDIEGVWIAENILKRLKASKKEIDRVKFCIGAHMFDLKNDVKESKIRRFIVKNIKNLDYLLWVKQADYSACKDDLNENLAVKKWRAILEKMKLEKVPFSLKELKVSALDLIGLGAKEKDLSIILNELWDKVIIDPKLNEKERLMTLAKKLIK